MEWFKWWRIEIEITLMGVRMILLCRRELVLRYVELEERRRNYNCNLDLNWS